MKKLLILFLSSLLCSCSPPKLDRNSDIKCHITANNSTFTIASSDRNNPVIINWLKHNEEASYTYAFSENIPTLTLNFANKVTVYFNKDSIHISPVSFRQYTRKRTAEDDELYNYLISLAPNQEQ